MAAVFATVSVNPQQWIEFLATVKRLKISPSAQIRLLIGNWLKAQARIARADAAKERALNSPA